MAMSFAKSLLAYAVALAVGGTLQAQNDTFVEGVRLLRLGKAQEALDKFREVLAKNPSNEEALKLYRDTDQQIWYMLLTEKGEIQQIAASIMERANVEQKVRSRDAAAIEALVAKACDGGYDQRHQATLKLAADHGEFAVPALVQRLGNADEDKGQANAIVALHEIGHTAVLPLLEALKNSNPQVRFNAAAALKQINDARALPAMARLVDKDDHENVREIAREFLKKNGSTGKAAELYVAAARHYLNDGVRPGSFADVIWTIDGDKLVGKDVPALVYAVELAKGCAYDGLAIDPLNAGARSLVAQTNLAEAYLIEESLKQSPDDATLKALAPVAGDFKLAALATGTPTLRAALDEGVRTGMIPVAVGAIEALGSSEDRDSIGSSTALLAALDNGDKRVSYSAAMAIVKASGGNNVPAADKVSGQLAMAVTEEARHIIQVIDGSPASATAVKAASVAERKNVVALEASAARGLDSVLRNPNVDIVVINEILPDRQPEDVIGVIHKDPRLAKVKIVITAKDIDKAKARFGTTVTDVIGPLTGETLVAKINEVMKDVPVEVGNARSETVAKGASEALWSMARGRANIGSALGSLVAQLNRADAVAVPAARALGLSGTGEQLAGLAGALAGSGSADLKAAVAEAIGMILSRGAPCPADLVTALTRSMKEDADPKVRAAAATALGKAKLSDGEKATLINGMRKIGSASKTEG